MTKATETGSHLTFAVRQCLSINFYLEQNTSKYTNKQISDKKLQFTHKKEQLLLLNSLFVETVCPS